MSTFSATPGDVVAFWDLENCPIPSRMICSEADSDAIVQRLIKVSKQFGVLRDFKGYVATDSPIAESSLSTKYSRLGLLGVNVHICAREGQPEVVDRAIMVDVAFCLKRYRESNIRSVTVVLITGDSDFALLISKILAYGYKVLLIPHLSAQAQLYCPGSDGPRRMHGFALPKATRLSIADAYRVECAEEVQYVIDEGETQDSDVPLKPVTDGLDTELDLWIESDFEEGEVEAKEVRNIAINLTAQPKEPQLKLSRRENRSSARGEQRPTTKTRRRERGRGKKAGRRTLSNIIFTDVDESEDTDPTWVPSSPTVLADDPYQDTWNDPFSSVHFDTMGTARYHHPNGGRAAQRRMSTRSDDTRPQKRARYPTREDFEAYSARPLDVQDNALPREGASNAREIAIPSTSSDWVAAMMAAEESSVPDTIRPSTRSQRKRRHTEDFYLPAWVTSCTYHDKEIARHVKKPKFQECLTPITPTDPGQPAEAEEKPQVKVHSGRRKVGRSEEDQRSTKEVLAELRVLSLRMDSLERELGIIKEAGKIMDVRSALNSLGDRIIAGEQRLCPAKDQDIQNTLEALQSLSFQDPPETRT